MVAHLIPMDERFWRHVDKRGPDECWEWTGQRKHRPGYHYGVLRRPRKGAPFYAHRYSVMLHFGMFDRRLNVLHRCDNPPCVNPAHLYLGTQRDNVRDMLNRGRGRWAR